MGEIDPMASDEQVLDRARVEGRILITLDKDIGELVVVRGLPHAGVVRLVGFAARDQSEAVLKVLDGHHRELKAGALVTANAKRSSPRVRSRRE